MFSFERDFSFPQLFVFIFRILFWVCALLPFCWRKKKFHKLPVAYSNLDRLNWIELVASIIINFRTIKIRMKLINLSLQQSRNCLFFLCFRCSINTILRIAANDWNHSTVSALSPSSFLPVAVHIFIVLLKKRRRNKNGCLLSVWISLNENKYQCLTTIYLHKQDKSPITAYETPSDCLRQVKVKFNNPKFLRHCIAIAGPTINKRKRA